MSNGECGNVVELNAYQFTFLEGESTPTKYCYSIKGMGTDEDRDLSNWQLGFDCDVEDFLNIPTPTCTVQVGDGPVETAICDPVPPSTNQSGVLPSYKFDTPVGKLVDDPVVTVCIEFDIPLQPGCVDIGYKAANDSFRTTDHPIVGPSCEGGIPVLECPVANPQTCCQEVIEFKTQLVPPAIDDFDFMGVSSQFEIVGTPVIESVCPEKVIVCGKVRKTYTYMAAFDDGSFGEQQLVDERSFQCVIDRDDANEGDTFAVVGAAVLCEGVPVLQNFGTKTILVDGEETVVDVAWKVSEKDIIKVCIRKVMVEPS